MTNNLTFGYTFFDLSFGATLRPIAVLVVASNVRIMTQYHGKHIAKPQKKRRKTLQTLQNVRKH